MFFKKESIADGITLSVMPSNKFKAGVISFSLTVPLTRHGSSYNHILSGLLRRGTKKYPTMSALNRRLDELYGSYVEIKSNHVGDNLSLTFTCEVLDNKYIPDGVDALGGVIDIVADMLLCPLFMESDFDTSLFDQEIKVIIDALNADINNTRVYAVKRCAEIMFEGHDEHPTVAATKQIVSSATLEGLRDYYRSLLASAPLDVFYIGATDEALIRSAVLSAFAKHKFSRLCKPCRVMPISREEYKEARVKMPVSQGKLAMCLSSGVCISAECDDYYTALLFNEIFGGSAFSKLFLNVREKLSLCYYCSSSFSTYTGIVTVSCGMDVKNFELARATILEQLEEIKRGNVNEDELYTAKRSLLNAYRQLYDSPFDLQSFYSGRMLFGIPDTIEDCYEKLSAVTLEQIVALAQNIKLDAQFFVEGTETSIEDEEDENER